MVAVTLIVLFQNCDGGFAPYTQVESGGNQIAPQQIDPFGLAGKTCNQLIDNPFHDSTPSLPNLIPADPARKASNVNIAFKSGDGIHNLLDIHYPTDLSRPRPIVVFIRGGDDGKQVDIAKQAPNLIDYLIEKGFIFASVNYRSYDQDRNLKVQDQATDIADAIKWLSQHASEFGGKSDDFVVMGFSTGAHLSALINADNSYLTKVGLTSEILKGSISMDVPHYDEALNLELLQGTYMQSRIPMLRDLFGSTPTQLAASSPISYLNSGRKLKPMLLYTTGFKDGQAQEVSLLATSVFKSTAERANQLVQYYPLQNFEHTQLGKLFNLPRGEPISAAMGQFLNRLYSNAQGNQKDRSRDQALFSEIDSALTPLIETANLAEKIPGAIIGVVGPGQTHLSSCGVADDTIQNKITASTLFSVGSVSKAFTGLILAKAVTEGRLRLDDPVANFLPSPLQATFLADPTLKAITFRHLVTHTSGLGSMPANLPKTDTNNPAAGYSLNLLNACFKSAQMASGCRPQLGTYAYSNLGIGLLGIALQTALNPALVNPTRPPYANFNDLLQQNLLFPAGISEIYGESDILLHPVHYFLTKPHDTSLGLNALGSVISQFAQGHSSAAGTQPSVRTLTFADMSILSSAGEVVVSGRSLLTLMKYISGADRSNSVISPALMTEATKILWTGSSKGKNISMSYATSIQPQADGTEVFEKAGSTVTGYQAYIAWSKQSRTGVFIVVNSSSPQFIKLKDELTQKLLLLAK